MAKYNPKVVCFSCKFGWGYLTDEARLSSGIRNWIPVICTGKIDATHMLDAFRKGADGILVLSCPEGNCHYQNGNYEARKKVHFLWKILQSYGINKERLRIELSSDPSGGRIQQLVKQMSKDLTELGPLNKEVGRVIKGG